MLASCAVFNEAHDQAVAFFGLDDDGRNFCLAELNERFNSTLTTNKVIAGRVRLALSWANGDRTLQPDVSDALNDFLKVSLISSPGIQKANLVDRNGLYAFRSLGLDLLMLPPEMMFGLPSNRESRAIRIGKHPTKARCLPPSEFGSVFMSMLGRM